MAQAATAKQAIDKVIAKMRGVMSRQEIVEAVLKLRPSTAKNPGSSIMNDLRWRKEIVALGNAKYARTDYVLDGAKFRVKVSAADLAQGITQRPWFNPFDQVLPPTESIFMSSDGEMIPVVTRIFDPATMSDDELKAMIISMGEKLMSDPLSVLALPLLGTPESDQVEKWDEQLDEIAELDEAELLQQARELMSDKLRQEVKGHDFSDFYQRHQVRAGDALIVTMKPKENTYLFEHEKAAQAQKLLIKQRDQELRQLIHQAIKREKRAEAREVIFRAYGNLPWLKEYPSSHWLEIVEKDDGLRLLQTFGDRLEIASIDYRMMFDMLGVDEITERKLKKRRKGIAQEVDDFLARLEQAYEAATEALVENFDQGGKSNVIAVGRKPRREKIAEHNDQLIEQFFQAEKEKRGEQEAGRKASDIALLSNFLSGYQGEPLEYATLDDLDEFLFIWYPRKVLSSSASHAKQLAASARDFYHFLVEAKIIRSAVFAEVIFKLRDLAGEKVELYDRLPAEGSEELFAQLFGWD